MGVAVFRIRSDKDTHFTGSLATGAGEEENLSFPGYHATKNPVLARAAFCVSELRVWSDENLAFEIQFYRKDIFDDTDADLDTFLGAHAFAAADGVQIGGAGLFRYVATGLSLFVYDDDLTGEVHIKLVNRSVASKTAGSNGEVVVEIGAENPS